MNPIVFKTNTSFCYQDKDKLHEEIMKYGFIEYIDKSIIDGEHMYKLHRQDLIVSRVHKMNQIFKKMGKELVSPVLNIKMWGTDVEANKFIDKYRKYIVLISTMEDHIAGFNGMI